MNIRYPVTDADSEPWWEALQRREFLVQSCVECRRLRWPGRAVCNDCGSERYAWVPATGQGTVASWTVTHTRRPDEATYAVVLVRLDDQADIFVPGFFDESARNDLSIGLTVCVDFDEVAVGNDGWQLVVLRWRPCDPAEPAVSAVE